MFIEKTIDSVREQTYHDWEVVAVDDGSTDKTPEILRRISDVDERVRTYRIPNTGKPSIVRNYAVTKAQGDVLAFLDSDDLWCPKKLEIQQNEFKKNPDVGLIYGIQRSFGNSSFFDPRYGVMPFPWKAAHDYHTLLKGNCISTSCVFMKKEMFLSIGGFSTDITFAEDFDFWLRVALKNKISFVPRILCLRRLHSRNFSNNNALMNESLGQIYRKNGNCYKNPYFLRDRSRVFILFRNFIHLIYIWFYIVKSVLKI